MNIYFPSDVMFILFMPCGSDDIMLILVTYNCHAIVCLDCFGCYELESTFNVLT